MAPHFSTLAWKIPWKEEPWWVAVHRVAKSRTRLSDFPFTFHFPASEKEMATHSSVLAWRIPGMGEPGGRPSLGSHRVGHDWRDSAAAAVALVTLGFPGGTVVINPLINAGDAGDVNLIPGLGRSPGGGNGNLLQYFCLKSPMGRGAWWVVVHGCAKSWTRLSTHTRTCNSPLVSMLLIPKIVIWFWCLCLTVLVNNF